MKKSMLLLVGLLLGVFLWSRVTHHDTQLPLVAVANYGPHASLNAAIDGMKQALAQQGWVENKTVRYAIQHVGFDHALIPQMINQLASLHPRVMVVLSTPVAQFAKGTVKDLPLIYSAVTDPVKAGLLQKANEPSANMTGSADQQNLAVFLTFVKQLLPQAHRIGLLYATSDANDLALLHMMQRATKKAGMSVFALPVAQAREVPLVMSRFKNQADFIYVGSSGPIQPTLPAIASAADAMHLPVFNVEEDAVKQGLVLANFGVDYHDVGRDAGKLVAAVLKGTPIAQLRPITPQANMHRGCVSRSKAAALGISLPAHLDHVTVVE